MSERSHNGYQEGAQDLNERIPSRDRSRRYLLIALNGGAAISFGTVSYLNFLAERHNSAAMFGLVTVLYTGLTIFKYRTRNLS